jgi:hypothetical protein
MLEEGFTYRFRVLRLITLPDDSQSWVLTHTGSDRYLLPAAYYSDYPIKESLDLFCRVDKINCTGRIFLEPEHPFYREGEIYPFVFVDEEYPLPDTEGGKIRHLVVKGIRGDDLHKCHLVAGTDISIGATLHLKVVRIKKGRLFLENADENAIIMEQGGRYIFSDLREWSSGFLEATGPGGALLRLEKSFYRNHHLHTGVSFKAFFIHWNEDGTVSAEPEHPVYQPDREYSFLLKKVITMESDSREPVTVLTVSDIFNNEIMVLGAEHIETDPKPREVTCRVLRLKKGRPVLKLVTSPSSI